MSLNGLDDVKVKEAHDAATTEPAGWFLLKYASRDEVDILDSGNGGVADIRDHVAKYDESSPLYGFLQYRGKSVIIKYTPEDCSRLVQARATVHFNAICDHFSHNATFEIGETKELKDSKLSAACSLHAASGSSSSSTSSLRRRRLNEIAEEEEEEERDRKRKSVVKEQDRQTSSVYTDSASPPASEPPVVLDPQQITDPLDTAFAASTQNVPDFTGAPQPGSPTRSDSDRRLSSQSARPEVYSSSTSYSNGRKIKLGPRPSVDAHKRPSTAENFRPVAALPAGFKFFKGSKKGKQENEQSETLVPLTPTALGQLSPSSDDQLPQRPNTSSGASTKSTSHSMAPAREGKITPEKARLMKAMKLREKRLMDAKLGGLASPTKDTLPAANTADAGASAESPKLHSIQIDTASHAPTTTNGAIDSPVSPTTKSDAPSRDAVLDSHPSSPGAASSTGIGDSTKASSLSDLTDETVQVSKEAENDVNDEAKVEAVEAAGAANTPDMQNGPEEQSGIETVDAPKSGTIDPNVSSDKSTKDAEESHPIPGSDPNIPQSTEATAIRTTEPADLTPDANSQSTLRAASRSDETLTNTENADSGSVKATADVPVEHPADQESGTDVSKVELDVPVIQSTSIETKSSTSSTSPTTPSLKSKFSRQDVDIPTESAPPTQTQTTPLPTPATDSEFKKPDIPHKTGPEIFLASPPKPLRQKVSVEPISTSWPAKGDAHIDQSDPFDDDALMEELQSATVQQARPILVSKSPITPVFPNSITSPSRDGRLPRAASNPMRGSHLMPVDMTQANTPRSVSTGSAAFGNGLSRTTSNASMQSKKGNVGSSISQRIKALEALSGNPNEERPRPATPSSTFFTVRKQSTREPSRNSVVDRAESLTRAPPTPERSRDSTPDARGSTRERSGSVASRLSMFEGQSAPRGRPESIQVTARIIRSTTSPYSNSVNAARNGGDSAPTQYRQSTLLVDVHRAQSVNPRPSTERPPLLERPQTSASALNEQELVTQPAEKQAKRRSSISKMKSFIKEHTSLGNKSTDNVAVSSPGPESVRSPSRPPSAHHNAVNYVRRLSTSSRRSSFTRDRDNESVSGATRSSSRISDHSSAEDDKSLSDKKPKGRASRFMRRLSSSFGGRKAGSASISPTVAEEDTDQMEKAAAAARTAAAKKQSISSPTIVAFMGDVNVQFPDNLLWKRRSMCLDAQGFLFLSTVQGGAKKVKEQVGTKRFYLGEFRKPYIPDVEIQELPNSVVLDFIEGSSLQIACGDRGEQQNVLRTLQEAHQNHAN